MTTIAGIVGLQLRYASSGERWVSAKCRLTRPLNGWKPWPDMPAAVRCRVEPRRVIGLKVLRVFAGSRILFESNEVYLWRERLGDVG